MGYNHAGEHIPQEHGRTVPITFRVSPVVHKYLEAECKELGLNPSGKPLDMSKLMRGYIVEHRERKEAARRKDAERKKKLDVRAYDWLVYKTKKWWHGQ